MSKKLYLECYSGISGDMTVAALLDLGANQKKLEKALSSLNLKGFKIEIKRVKKSALDALDFDVILDKAYENHDHDMNYLYGEKNADHSHEDEKHNHSHHHHHDDEHSHTHSHEHKKHSHHKHEHKHHHHSHEHRGLKEITQIINQSNITENAKKIALKIFGILAEAEAKAHGVLVEEVHFHEVGAVDSIVDIVSVAVCLDDLEITELVVPVLYEGRGFVRCQHGVIPIPVPAVSFIASKHNLSLHITENQGEFITPTGAAIVASMISSKKLPENFEIEKIGIGAGKREYKQASILRAMLINDTTANNTDFIYKLETNIDDSNGEALGYLMQKLLEQGALDVHYTPVFMKKNRPAYQLNVICSKNDLDKLEEVIFAESTTIGIRKFKVERSVLKREIKEFQSSLGTVLVKVCQLKSTVRYYPEYESIIEICQKNNLSYQEVYDTIKREFHEQL